MRTPRPGQGDQFPIPEGGYVSARDMPTFVEMEKNLAMLKAAGLFVPGSRDQIKEIEKRLAEMVESVDGFYAVMQGRDWVYSDQFRQDELRGPIEASDVEALEAVVIASYNDPSRLDRLIAQLSVVPDMRDRMPMVRLARDDYFAGRFYSTTLVLIAVMDGFVNDIERARRGLTARDPDEINAWDSVVGHHLGLKNAHRAFTQTFKATSAQEIYSLHRNGIVHGNLVNFNNLIVATKAWNRLLAVKDWATAIEKAKEPATAPPPPVSESFKQMVATARRFQTLKEWKPRTIELERDGAEQLQREPAGAAAAEFFDAWRRTNYGAMASRRGTEPSRRRQALRWRCSRAIRRIPIDGVSGRLRSDDERFSRCGYR